MAIESPNDTSVDARRIGIPRSTSFVGTGEGEGAGTGADADAGAVTGAGAAGGVATAPGGAVSSVVGGAALDPDDGARFAGRSAADVTESEL